MTHKYTNMDVALPIMAFRVLSDGQEIGSRLGEKTLELLHQQIILEQPWQREVLVPTRNVNIAAQIAETMWVLAGQNDIEFLGHYLPRAKDFSDDGKVWRGAYGPRLRQWGGWPHQDNAGKVGIDQIRHILDLFKEDRSTRRAVVSIYDPSTDSAPGKDIPCNDFLSFISRDGYLHLSVFVRSNDLVWGWSGINAFEWSALQEIVAGLLGLRVGNLVFNTTSLHIYDRHWKKAHSIQDHGAFVPVGLADSPRFNPSAMSAEHPIHILNELTSRWFNIEERLRNQGFLEGEAEQIIMGFPEPMLRSWLLVIAWYWSGDEKWIARLVGTRLWAAAHEMPGGIKDQIHARKSPPPLEIVITADTSGFTKAMEDTTGKIAPLAHKMSFIEYVDDLHREKSAAYGDSWKKRGELFSIIPNVARKIDRLEGGKSTEDEVIADTAVDLLVYLVKYRLWLGEQHPQFKVSWASEHQEDIQVRRALENLHAKCTLDPEVWIMPSYVTSLVTYFEHLQQTVSLDPHNENPKDRVTYVDQMITWSFILSRHLWEQEQGEATSGYVNQDG